MTGTEYREQLRKIVTTLKAEGFSETNINLAMPVNYIANTRMHLNQDQVRELVSHLQRWLDTGSFNGE